MLTRLLPKLLKALLPLLNQHHKLLMLNYLMHALHIQCHLCPKALATLQLQLLARLLSAILLIQKRQIKKLCEELECLMLVLHIQCQMSPKTLAALRLKLLAQLLKLMLPQQELALAHRLTIQKSQIKKLCEELECLMRALHIQCQMSQQPLTTLRLKLFLSAILLMWMRHQLHTLNHYHQLLRPKLA
jgi:hypothetical protein